MPFYNPNSAGETEFQILNQHIRLLGTQFYCWIPAFSHLYATPFTNLHTELPAVVNRPLILSAWTTLIFSLEFLSCTNN